MEQRGCAAYSTSTSISLSTWQTAGYPSTTHVLSCIDCMHSVASRLHVLLQSVHGGDCGVMRLRLPPTQVHVVLACKDGSRFPDGSPFNIAERNMGIVARIEFKPSTSAASASQGYRTVGEQHVQRAAPAAR